MLIHKLLFSKYIKLVREFIKNTTDRIKTVQYNKTIYIFEFKNEDIVRNKFLIELTNRYDKYRSERPSL